MKGLQPQKQHKNYRSSLKEVWHQIKLALFLK